MVHCRLSVGACLPYILYPYRQQESERHVELSIGAAPTRITSCARSGGSCATCRVYRLIRGAAVRSSAGVLDEKVLNVRAEVGESPGDVLVVPTA